MAAEGIRHLHFLHISDRDAVRAVLRGASRLLRHSRIDFVQFPLDTYDLLTNQTLVESFVNRKYVLLEYRVIEGMEAVVSPYALFNPQRPRATVTLLAVHERLLKLFGLVPAHVAPGPMIPEICATHRISPRGIIHVGAHEGTELPWYQSCGFQKILFIEANPTVFEKLRVNAGDAAGVTVVKRAVTDKAGPIRLNVTTFDQSRSILALGTHLQHYPGVEAAQSVIVVGATLDTVLGENGLDRAEFNFLSMDIQGAELLALRGAAGTLAHIQALITEIHFEDLYQGCAQIDGIDLFLESQGFERVNTYSIHRAYGDRFAARVGASLLTYCGLGGMVASNPDEYVQQAAALARQPELLARFRREFRTHLVSTPVFDNRRLTRVNLYQQNLATHLSQSDATIATLSNQVTYFQDLFFPIANGTSS